MRVFRFFLDTSALFAGIWSARGGARLLLRLGETGKVRLLVSRRVLWELETAFSRKAPDLLPDIARLLHLVDIEIAPDPSPETIRRVLAWKVPPGDAEVLAAALEARPDFFVTLDRKHFLNRPDLSSRIPFPIGTPGDAVQWWRDRALSQGTPSENV